MQIARKPETSQKDYFEVIGKKTAELFGASCKSGVIVAGGNVGQQNALTVWFQSRISISNCR